MIASLLLAALIATPATVTAQLKAAQPGDAVQLVGVFDHVALKARAFDPPLTLDLSQATLANLYLDTVQGVTVTGGTFRAAPGDWKGALYATGSAHVHVTGVAIAAANGPGVTFRQGSDLTLDASRIDGAHNAVQLQQVDGFHVSGVAITGMSGDGVDVFSSWRGSVTSVVCAGVRAIDASHRDCVQLADTIAGAQPTSDIEIGWNLAHGDTQGFTSFRPNPGHVRIWIHDNIAAVSNAQGVALYDGDSGSRVERNHVLTLPGAPNQTKVNVVGGAAVGCGNTADAGAGKPAVSDAACAVH